MTKFINLSKYPFTIFSSLIILLFAVSASVSAQNIEEGEKLYKANCTACHQIDSKLIGPALRGVSDKYSEEWLIKWIKNSAEMIAAGDPDAIAIWEEYNKSPMTAFPYFSDDDVKNILAYIEQAPEKQAVVATTSVDGGAIVVEDQTSDYVILTIAIVLLLVIAGLWKIKNTLKEVAGEESEDLFSSIITLVNAFFARKSIVTLTVFIILGFGVNSAWNLMLGVGVTKGYAPEQPIAYSHKLHSGINGIDCNYCHHSARHGKSAAIPSANVCMNCHTYINEGPSGKAEIQKIYDAVGFDPEKGQYIQGYEQKPIKWVRIHNLPDHAYFNHSQHVVAGGLECQDCHGAIEEMEVVEQHAELTMGWCIDCHRQTEVKVADNDYYEEMHAKFKENHPGEAFNVEAIGGLECGKCHH
ncbi:MAG TPA: cytochrome C [Flavobacteriales bacterium]|nr:cytochrome C [Flavobacteriales bacterium]